MKRFLRIIAITSALIATYFSKRPPERITHWLQDQVDQIQAASGLFAGHLKFLYGCFMSDTNPPVYTPGPIGQLVFGIPTLLTGSPISGHNVLTTLQWAALGFFILTIWDCFGIIIALICGAFYVSSNIWWWTTELFWEPPLTMLFANLAMTLLIRSVHRPQSGDLWLSISLLAMAMHVHIVGFCLIPLTIYFLLRSRRNFSTEIKALKRPTIYLPLSISVFPYVIAEIIFRFQNTKAIFSHVQKSSSKAMNEGVNSFFTVLKFYVGLVEQVFKPISQSLLLQILVGMAGLLLLFSIKKKSKLVFRDQRLIAAVVSCALIPVVHALFFYKMNRPILGNHYLALGLPATAAFMCLCFVLLKRINLFFYWGLGIYLTIQFTSGAVHLTPRNELTLWTWQRVSQSLRTVCEKFGANGLTTLEGAGFKTYSELHSPVLEYSLRNFNVGCQFNKDSDVVLVPDMFNKLDNKITFNEKEWRLIDTFSPNIGVYMKDK